MLIPDSPIEAQVSSSPSVLAGWNEGRTMSFGVGSEATKEYALIDSYSYKFSSPQQVQAVLDTVQYPNLLDGASLLDSALAPSSKSRSNAWRAWYGTDSEGLPAYVVMIQSGSYVAKVYLTVGPNQDSFGRRLLNHVAKQIRSGKVGSIAATEITTDQPGVLPNWWASNVAASHWLYQDVNGERHYLATWPWPYGNSQHYVGPGGDTITCISTSGCISNWTWWLTNPESRLGVPKSFLILDWPDANNIYYYTASVWMD